MNRNEVHLNIPMLSDGSRSKGKQSDRMPWEIISEIRARINVEEMNRRRQATIINVNLTVLLIIVSAIGFIVYRR